MTTELFEVVTPQVALERLFAHLTPLRQTERVPGEQAVGRVLAADLGAPERSPAFRRSVMDGYAVRAADTFGASESLPGYLTRAGEVPMGQAATMPVMPGTAMLIHTGRTSMHIAVDVSARLPRAPETEKATHCIIVFVGVDEAGQPSQVPTWTPASDADRALQDYAVRLMELRKTIESEMGPRITG